MPTPPLRVIPVLLPDISHRRNLHPVFPSGSTLLRQSVPDINPNMPLHPHRSPNLNFGKILRFSRTHFKHLITINIPNPVAFVLRPSVNGVFIALPPPKHPLDKTNAVKPKSIRGSRFNHLRSRRLVYYRSNFCNTSPYTPP